MLTSWAADGSLGAPAREALRLDVDPAQLTELISQWAPGDFSALPPIEVVEGSVLPGAAGAYAISTGTIYLNGDWLASASEDRVIAVLTEELGCSLDWLAHAIHKSIYPLNSHWNSFSKPVISRTLGSHTSPKNSR